MTHGGEIVAICVTGKGLTYKERFEIEKKKSKNLIEKMGKGNEQTVHRKKKSQCLLNETVSQIIREMQLKTSLKKKKSLNYHFLLFKNWQQSKTLDNSLRLCRLMHYWWEGNMEGNLAIAKQGAYAVTLWPNKLIPGIYPDDTTWWIKYMICHRSIVCINQRQDEPGRPSIGNWWNNLRCVHIMSTRQAPKRMTNLTNTCVVISRTYC